MKVNGPSEIKSNAISRRKKAASGGEGFAVSMSSGVAETEAAQGVACTAPVTSLDSLLALQEVDERPARSFKRGADTLDLLDDIRHGLLMGGIPLSKLQALTRLIADERGHVCDPQLAAILDEIDLRAQVELAKYGSDII